MNEQAVPTDEYQKHLSCDLMIAGGGVVGLWLARYAAEAGLSVILLDRAAIGAGASGGILGALMPHMPENWNAKKQFQFEALVSLEEEISLLEADTGVKTGYRRSGRLMPLADVRQRERAVQRAGDADARWVAAENVFRWSVTDDARWPHLLDGDTHPFGMVFDDLSARIDPRRLLEALTADLARRRNVQIIEGATVRGWESGRTTLSDGREAIAGKLAVTAGHGSFPMLADLFAMPENLGAPVKGQAALLAADPGADAPIIFDDGVYVVPHEGGRVAIGSTSESEFADPASTDIQLDDLLERASRLSPLITGAQVVKRWAGLRPRAAAPDPMIGHVPDHQGIVVATGGFKITLGIAHRMARLALDLALGVEPDIPNSFTVSHHLERARRKT